MRQRDWQATLGGIALLVLGYGSAAAAPAVPVSHGRFEQVPVLLPEGEPKRVVIWLAGHGDDARRRRQAEALREDGAMVALVDTARLYAVLAREGGRCGFSSGDVENFSRYLQAFQHVPTYHLPLLVGDGAGSALAYALAAQAPEHVLAGVVTDGLCPQSVAGAAICGTGVAASGAALRPVPLPTPWLAAAAGPDARCPADALDRFAGAVPQARVFKRAAGGDMLPGLRAAAISLGAQQGVSLPPPPAGLGGLPVVEVPAPGADGDTFAIFVSGDGGWAGLDKEVAAALAQAGIPVVGVDSLRYFWSRRTPQGFADDLDRIARFYAQRWQRRNLVLIGFSQGADVLPAAINRLPAATREQLRLTALLSVGKLADYEFHVSNWLGASDDGLPIAPEIARLPPGRTLCIYGEADEDALCPELPAAATQRIALPGDHHFQGDYARLARTILEHLR